MRIKSVFVGSSGKLGATVEMSVDILSAYDSMGEVISRARVPVCNVFKDELTVYVDKGENEHEELARMLSSLAEAERIVNEDIRRRVELAKEALANHLVETDSVNHDEAGVMTKVKASMLSPWKRLIGLIGLKGT